MEEYFEGLVQNYCNLLYKMRQIKQFCTKLTICTLLSPVDSNVLCMTITSGKNRTCGLVSILQQCACYTRCIGFLHNDDYESQTFCSPGHSFTHDFCTGQTFIHPLTNVRGNKWMGERMSGLVNQWVNECPPSAKSRVNKCPYIDDYVSHYMETVSFLLSAAVFCYTVLLIIIFNRCYLYDIAVKLEL